MQSLNGIAQNQSYSEGPPQRKRRKLLVDQLSPEGSADVEYHPQPEYAEGGDVELAEDSGSEERNGPEDDVHGEDDAPGEREGFEDFELHFANPDENELAARLKRISENQWSSKKMDVGGGRGVLQVPSAEDIALDRRRLRSTRDVQLKARLVENAQKAVGTFKEGVEQAIAPSIFGYQDVLFGGRTVQNAGRLRDITCLHALNHILIGRDRVLKNNAKLAAATEDEDVEYRDQGFTRPKILFLLETKQACVRALDSITKMYDFELRRQARRLPRAV
jgi:U3 small nucleolar RNA-associated protein 25